ncbi:hypothetical protein [Megamonas funiformis]|jgi:hypothetical protein|uniref:hypothetical protein n=1 Tax=Megamonas funiformis TaxID=437897 RepID=UPI00206E42AB|nr:hypothetical protein [Megamonas funiformis]DAU21746.1 MAG TPA: hypothetical protein [Caudoviricetes sp.]
MTNSLKEEISLTITTIDTLIVNLKNNIRIDSKRIFIVKKITKKYIESLNLVLTMNMNKKSDEIDDSFIKNFIYDENDIDNTISFLNEVRSILNKILFEIEHIKKL